MTRSPLRSEHVEGVDGPEYQLNEICAAPGCLSPSEDPHHLFRRTALGGPYWWVQLEPGLVTGNVIGLCRKHHDMITTDAAWITFEDGMYVWSTLFDASVLLNHQPPFKKGVGEPSANGSEGVRTAPTASEGSCPTCLRPLPHKREAHEPKRPRRTWSITVPMDQRENGAEVLDTLLEEGRRELAKAGMPYGDADSAKFFVMSSILALFVQHAGDVLA